MKRELAKPNQKERNERKLAHARRMERADATVRKVNHKTYRITNRLSGARGTYKRHEYEYEVGPAGGYVVGEDLGPNWWTLKRKAA